MKKILVEGRTDLERDSNSKAVISRDIQGYKKRLVQKRLLLKKEEEITELKNKVDKLTNLVETLIEKIDK